MVHFLAWFSSGTYSLEEDRATRLCRLKLCFVSRIDAALDLVAIGGQGLLDLRGQIGVSLDETGHEFFKHAQQVVADQDLAIAAGTGADADGGDGDLLG